MKVLVVNSMAPFIWGGAEELAKELVLNLRSRNFDAELLRVPFSWEPFSGISNEIARCKMMKLPNVDKVISMKFPSYHIPADNKTIWLIHQYRQAYDMWDSPYSNLPKNEKGLEIRNLIRRTDNHLFRNVTDRYTISDEVSRRLSHYNGVDAEPLRAPINKPELFSGGEACGYILAPGRINASKRQHLLVEAMHLLPKTARLVIAGPPETDGDLENLKQLVAKYDLHDQVKLDLRFLSKVELADYVNHATAVAYLPHMEDSYGYITMEAFQAAKPVVTCRDSGELLKLVFHGNTGFVCEPEPVSLADAIEKLLYSKHLSEDMGQEARKLWLSKDINWSSHIRKLLGRQ